ncbi:MAG: lamin tail domain-containing protein [Candidatus Krumholzibacteria bacterium]|nr:lamin tail domain-containing protein [Candidatus Krumholzibacteria bacterium]
MRNVAVFVCFLFVLFPPSQGDTQIRLNEILADPASDWDGDGAVSSRSDEWVEIINVGTSIIDISSYRLGDLSGGTSWRFGFDGTVAPGEVRLVFGSESVAWETANGFPAFGLSLNNAGDAVFLYDVAGGDTIVVDQYAYSAFETEDDRATGRLPDGVGDWFIFDALNPYPGTTPPLGNGCAPTPGHDNVCQGSVPVEETTWGAVKALFSD